MAPLETRQERHVFPYDQLHEDNHGTESEARIIVTLTPQFPAQQTAESGTISVGVVRPQ